MNFSKAKETLKLAFNFAQESDDSELQIIYEQLLREFGNQLKEMPENDFWRLVLGVQEESVSIARKLPNVTDEEFDDYVFNNDLLGILLEPLRR